MLFRDLAELRWNRFRKGESKRVDIQPDSQVQHCSEQPYDARCFGLFRRLPSIDCESKELATENSVSGLTAEQSRRSEVSPCLDCYLNEIRRSIRRSIWYPERFLVRSMRRDNAQGDSALFDVTNH